MLDLHEPKFGKVVQIRLMALNKLFSRQAVNFGGSNVKWLFMIDLENSGRFQTDSIRNLNKFGFVIKNATMLRRKVHSSTKGSLLHYIQIDTQSKKGTFLIYLTRAIKTTPQLT